MKIFAIGRNYVAHIEELGNERPDEPVVFTMPNTALLTNNKPFYYPDFSKDIHHEVELVLRICRNGKYIDEKFAHKYYDSIGVGIDLTARDLQAKAKKKGLPWAIAKGFNGSAPLSNEFIKVEDIPDVHNINFRLDINGEVKQAGNTNRMMFSFDAIIAYLSQFFLIQKGDLIFTGTPAGVGPVQIGDTMTAYFEDKKMLSIDVK
ncbi:fumarylacetoacetate hydrolase family protein [uncultured Microscilla sp.]|uniref:fumarylacetoacetate hydrolase family protein n=1 Tax=uncultured Microscilla sp. TaxID=432653 RepID=UPI00260F754D|nr:fumarylacetoacetate hydrolase family protein [uncultured Microscilla sp.]